MNNDCVFCKILAGKLLSARVYEDEHALAFLDIAPFEEGHILVIPRVHAVYLTDLPADALAPLVLAVQRVGEILLKKMPCNGFNVLQSNGACATQVVPHVHFHVIPRWDGRQINWIPREGSSFTAMQTLAARLRG